MPEPKPTVLPGGARALLRSAQAAELLAISPRLLWSLTQTGQIPCVRIGRAVRYDAADLAAWIEQNKTRNTVKTT